MNASPSPDILIIGGGLGGLFTGALLAQAGRRVTVLERGHTAGGGLQQFERYGKWFATGMHLVGGLSEGSALRRICTHLGIAVDDLALRPCDALAEVELQDGDRYLLPATAAERLAYLQQLFPHEAEGIAQYETALRGLTDEVDLFHLRRRTGVSPFAASERLLQPADAFVAQFVRDPKLRQLLQFADLLYDARPGHTAAYVHAVVSTLYRRDMEQPVMGSPSLAEALIEVIVRHGGEVRTDTEVTHLSGHDRHIDAVESAGGLRWEPNVVIAAIAPQRLLPMMPEGLWPKAYARRVAEMPMGTSALKVFYDLKPECVPFQGHPTFVYGPERWMYVTPPVARQGAWAETLEAICPMPFAEVSAWTDSRTGRRPAAYEAWKARQIDAVTERLAARIPGFRDAVRHTFAATPLTWRDWLGSPEGAMFGPLKDCLDPARTQLSVTTKVDNLFLTGQSVHQHGICGTPLTAVLTAEAILGEGSLLGIL
jgi:all-trans-retinol 13,14-reductase